MVKIKIGFTGDMAFSEYTKDLYKDPNNIDSDIYSFLNSNDYNVINFESPITDSEKTNKSALAHKSDKDSIQFIKNNFKNPVLSLANNHMMDFEYKGLIDTLKILKQQEIPYIGAGRDRNEACNYIILGDEVKVGIISFQYKANLIATKLNLGVAHEKHEEIIRRNLKELKDKVDWIILVYHGGEEFLNVPMPYIRKKMKKFLNWGADILVVHHPHTVQGYEKIGNRTIFYSLGNFIFDTDFQRAQKGTQEGELLRISFDKEKYEFENLDIFINRKEEKITTMGKNPYFKDINKNYFSDWRKEAKKFEIIKNNKKELKEKRLSFSVKELYIEKTNCENFMDFEDLVDKYYFKNINKPLKSTKNKTLKKFIKNIKKKVKKLKNINYKKVLCMIASKLNKNKQIHDTLDKEQEKNSKSEKLYN